MPSTDKPAATTTATPINPKRKNNKTEDKGKGTKRIKKNQGKEKLPTGVKQQDTEAEKKQKEQDKINAEKMEKVAGDVQSKMKAQREKKIAELEKQNADKDAQLEAYAKKEKQDRDMIVRDVMNNMFVQLEKKWAQNTSAPPRPVSTNPTDEEQDESVPEEANHNHNADGSKTQDEHSAPVGVGMEQMADLLAEDGFSGTQQGTANAYGVDDGPLPPIPEDSLDEDEIDYDEDSDDDIAQPKSQSSSPFDDYEEKDPEADPNDSAELKGDLPKIERDRLLQRLKTDFQVDEDTAKFYVKVYQGGMQFSKDGNFFVSALDPSLNFDLNKPIPEGMIARVGQMFGTNPPTQTQKSLLEKMDALPSQRSARPYNGEALGAFPDTVPMGRGFEKMNTQPFPPVASPKQGVSFAPMAERNPFEELNQRYGSSGGAGSVPMAGRPVVGVSGSGSDATGAYVPPPPPPPPAGGPEILPSIVNGVFTPRPTRVANETPRPRGSGNVGPPQGGVGAGNVGVQNPAGEEDLTGDGSVYDIAQYISGGKPSGQGVGKGMAKGAKNTQMEMNHRLKSSASQLISEMKCMHQVFDPLIPEMAGVKHKKEMQSAMQSGDISAIRTQHAKMQSMVAAYYGQASMMKVGLIIDADSYVRAFGSLIGSSGGSGGGDGSGGGGKRENHSEVDKYGRTRFKSKSRKEHVRRGGINTRRVIENRIPRVLPNTNIPTRAPLFKPRTDVVRPDVPRRFANPYAGIKLKVKNQ